MPPRVPTYKLGVSGKKVTRKPGRAKGQAEKGPRMSKAEREELDAIRREQAKARRMAALRRRQVSEALDGESLPAGASVNDLTPIQAQEIALERQGARDMARQLREQTAAARVQVRAINEGRAEARDQRNQIQNTLGQEIQNLSNRLANAQKAAITELQGIRAASGHSYASAASPAGAASASPGTPKKTVVPPTQRRAPASRKLPTPEPTPGQAGRRVSSRSTKGKQTQQKADGLDPFRVAMALAENGDVEGAKKMIRSLKRAGADPVTKCIAYIESLE